MPNERRSASLRRGGRPLWRYLAALVVIPLVGVAVLTADTVRTGMADAASAARAQSAVRAVAALNAARSGVESEVLPVLAAAVLGDPTTLAAMGLTGVVGSAQASQMLGSVPVTRAATDRALALVPARSVGWSAAQRAAGELAALRARADEHALGLVDVYTAYLKISGELMVAGQQAAVAANSEELPVATLRATRDVRLVAQLAQAASHQMPLFLGFELSQFAGLPQFAGFNDPATGSAFIPDQAWKAAWLQYSDAERTMDELSQASLRSAWSQVRDSAATGEVDGVLAAESGVSAPGLSVPQLVGVLAQTSARDIQLSGLLNTAVSRAQSLAAADRARASRRLTTTLGLGMGLLLASLLAAFFLGRSVSRALRVLAGQATRVSQGSLVDVTVGGPREVRTVSTALGSAVAGLRRIQDQADAVARGDLSAAVLNEPLPGQLGEVVHASVQQIVTAVRQREELQSALAHQAAHDPLTELPNRAQAVILLNSALHRATRTGAMTGLLFVDLDGFKAVNDSHGHATGDEVLREVASRLDSTVRAGDIVCRLGGDEFVVVVEPVQTERDLLELAERLIAAVSQPFTAVGKEITVGASVGIAVSRDAGTDVDTLFAEADTAAYRAKQHGRGRAEIFDERLRQQLSAQAELEEAIAHGLANGEMELHYQPVIDVTSGQLSGYEALIRWQRPDHGMVPPDEFIPAAERSSLICELDRWVLGEATRQLAEWRESSAPDPAGREATIAVNISGRHLADRQVVQDVADALMDSGLPARLLIVEVTETVLIDDPAALDHLAALRDLGVAVAIDDFGTGYTSIGQLGHMPVDTLKIDRSFIASTDPGNRELVALMIRAAHTFGLTVVGEGVEEPAQLDRLKADSCDHVQGYLLHRPLLPADARALLQAPMTTSTVGR